jgi:hypothetical protein
MQRPKALGVRRRKEDVIGSLVYGLAAFGLYRLWSSSQQALWWALLVAAVLMFLTGETVKTAVRDLAATDVAVAANPLLASLRSPDGSTNVVRFWITVNMVITGVTLVLAIWGIVASYRYERSGTSVTEESGGMGYTFQRFS